MSELTALLRNLDPDPHVRGTQFEHICKWFLLNDPSYKPLFKNVWLWDEWPGRWGADEGIDLVAEPHDGPLWAVQAKCYDPDYSIKKADVDSFLSASARREFSYRLLIGTTNHIGRKVERTLQKQEKPAGRLLRSDLERAAVEWPASPSDLRAPKPKRKEPRPHQQEAMDAVTEGFETSDRGQLIMACGTGKTLVALWMVERLESTRTLILLPSLSLLAQTLREWTANAREPFALLPVCSDETVGGIGDAWVSNTSDLGRPVTTDPAEIAAFLRKRGPRVVFATYQSSPRIEEAFALGRVPAFDFAIADEAHRVAGALDKDFATILDADAIKARNRLFMTATPRFFTGRVKKAAKESDHEIAGMRDETHFGPEFHRLKFGEAIKRDLLSDYRVVIVGVDNPTYREYAERGTFVSRDGQEVTDARTLASHIALAKTMKEYDLRRTISFHGRVHRAREFSRDFPDVVAWMPKDERPDGKLVTDHVSGKMPSGQRDIRIDRLKELDAGERGLLSNARCLGEGVDVPALDGVAFIDPRRSQVDIVQAVGRAIRKTEDKTTGTIVLPVFIAEGDDPDTVLEESAFNHIWQVVRALRDHDEELAELLDQFRRELGRRGTGPDWPIRTLIFKDVKPDFARAFQTRLVEQTTQSWEFSFGLLERFVEREGHARVPAKHIEDEHPLGAWVHLHRYRFKKGALERDRIERLEKVVGWVWDQIEADWNENFARLEQFIEREGHARVHQHHIEDESPLGKWVHRQRMAFKNGTLERDRIERLERVVGWVWDPIEADWNEGFAILERFVEREGHARVLHRHIEDEHELGKWVLYHRARFKKGALGRDRIERLEKVVGWVWDALEAVWNEGFAMLEQFVEREGHARIPARHIEDEHRLGAWVNTQRIKFKKGTLERARVERLKAIEGWVWDAQARRIEADWNENFARLEQFVEREGHARVHQHHIEDERPLGTWVTRQRMAFKNGTLERDRIERLERVVGWVWDLRKTGTSR